MSSTKPTAPSSSQRAVFVVSLRKLFLSGSTLALQPVFDAGNVRAIRAATFFMFSVAWSSVTPGLSRPITSSQ
jgi:hypothetical protein